MGSTEDAARVSKLSEEATDVSKAAVDKYGTAALTRDAEEGAAAEVEEGRGVLQTIYWRTPNASQLETAVTDLAQAAENDEEDATGELRVQIKKALKGDDVLVDDVEKIIEGKATGTEILDGDDAGSAGASK